MNEERRVWICQCLCPDRHCILAMANEADTEDEAKPIADALRAYIAGLLRDRTLNARCAICDAHPATWRYELRRTRFATMAEAEPELVELQARNLKTNRLWGDLHLTRPN